jgi:L,D-peptidoglycan transpeptidase YkuD (ErfK/YbiS/YcfS/YnhG family)
LQQRDRRPTQGCIAFAFEDLRRLLPRLSARPRLVIY